MDPLLLVIDLVIIGNNGSIITVILGNNVSIDFRTVYGVKLGIQDFGSTCLPWTWPYTPQLSPHKTGLGTDLQSAY